MVCQSRPSANTLLIVSVLAVLNQVGSQGSACPKEDLTTAAASTRLGASLLQAKSLQHKVSLPDVREAQPNQEVRDETEIGTSSDVSQSHTPRGMYMGMSAVDQASEDFEQPSTPKGMYKGMSPVDKEASKDAQSSSTASTARGISTVSEALGHFEGEAANFTSSLSRVVKWAVHDVSQRGVSKRTSGVLMFLVLLLLILAAVCFAMTRPRPETPSSHLKLSGIDRDSPLPGRLSPRQLSGDVLDVPTPDSVNRLPVSAPFSSSSSRQWPGGHGHDMRYDMRQWAAEERQFYLDPVLAHEVECTLVVPVHIPKGTFSICDINGRAVLHALPQTAGIFHYDAPRPLWRLALRTVTGESFAHLREMMPSTAGSVSTTGLEFQVLDAKEEYFASLVKLKLARDQQRFQLTTQTGDKLQLWGNFQTHCVNITDEQGGLLAATEPCRMDFDQAGAYYRLRVARVGNAGLPLCALLCIGQSLRSSQA